MTFEAIQSAKWPNPKIFLALHTPAAVSITTCFEQLKSVKNLCDKIRFSRWTSVNRNMYAYMICGLRNRRKTLCAELCRNERKPRVYASATIRVEASSFFYAFLTTDWLKKVARVFLTNHKLYELNLTKSKPEFEMNLGPSTDNCSAYFLLVYLLDLFSLFKDKTT